MNAPSYMTATTAPRWATHPDRTVDLSTEWFDMTGEGDRVTGYFTEDRERVSDPVPRAHGSYALRESVEVTLHLRGIGITDETGFTLWRDRAWVDLHLPDLAWVAEQYEMETT